MRTLPEVQELIAEIEREVARLELPLAEANEQHVLCDGAATAAVDAFIRDWQGSVGIAKNVAAAENAELVDAAVKAKARWKKGESIMASKRVRLDALRSESASLKAEMELLGVGHG